MNQTQINKAFNITLMDVSTPMVEALLLWSKLYKNEADWTTADTPSLSLPSAIAGEIARLTTIEMEVNITGKKPDQAPDTTAPVEPAPSKRADYLSIQFDKVMSRLREEVEYGCAKGGMVIKPYVNGKEIAFNFVQADEFFPIEFDANDAMVDVVFSDQRKIGDTYYTRLERHTMGDTVINGKPRRGCNIINKAYKSSTQETLGSEIELSSVPAWAELEGDKWIAPLDKPLFSYFKFPQANNIDTASPLGVSCYARAAMGTNPLIKQADDIWSNFLWEFESGKRAIDVDELAFDRDSNDNPILPNRRLYRTYKQSGTSIGAGGDLFKEWTPTLREQNILAGLNAILKRIEFVTSLAYGTLSDPNLVDKTATEIVSQKQRSYALVSDTQKALQATIEQTVWAMNAWADINKLSPRGDYDVSCDFDDSLIVDSQAQFSQDQQAVGMSAMSKQKFLERNYGLTPSAAQLWVKEAQEERPPVDLFSNLDETGS